LSDADLAATQKEDPKRMAKGVKTGLDPIVRLTSSDFDTYVKSDQPVFVDFWAEWCPPCKAMEPVIERLATRYSGKIIFGKLNTDEESEIATRYDVMSIPTFIVFKNGRPLDTAIGAVGEVALDKLIQRSVGGSSTIHR
jgi:thioredoxin 1